MNLRFVSLLIFCGIFTHFFAQNAVHFGLTTPPLLIQTGVNEFGHDVQHDRSLPIAPMIGFLWKGERRIAVRFDAWYQYISVRENFNYTPSNSPFLPDLPLSRWASSIWN